MTHLLAALTLAIIPLDLPVHDTCDVIETNHFYDEQGRHVFDQAIFWEWHRPTSTFRVRDWRLLKTTESYPDRGGMSWIDGIGGNMRRVTANHGTRETWTQFDPELVNRAELPKEKRRELTDINLLKNSRSKSMFAILYDLLPLLLLAPIAMASGVTNRGKYNFLDYIFRNATEVTNFFIALITDAVTPTADTNTFTELTEIAAGTGYTAGGISLDRNSTDFDVLTEDDANDRALIQLKNIVWTASGGPIPTSGDGARYAILTDDNGTQSSREIWAYWDLASARTVSDGQTLSLIDCELRLTD